MKKAIAAVLAFTICISLSSCVDKNSPDYKYDHAVKLMNSGKYAEAVTEFDSLNGYKDSAELSRKATNDIMETFEAWRNFLFLMYSPIKAPNNGPKISPHGIKNKPAKVPMVVPQMAGFEPPPIFVNAMGIV